MVQDEVTWVLETIESDWPGEFPNDLYRINRDEPEVLETGERTRSLELSKANALGATQTSRSPTADGTEYDHRVETVVACRLEGLTSQSGEHGHIDSVSDFETLVRYAQHALLQERSYPTIDADDEIGEVAYHSLFIESEQSLSHEHRDYFRTDWDVRLVGYASLPET